MTYFDGDSWLDGPGFAAWLEPRLRPDMRGTNSSIIRRLWQWRQGTKARFETVEPVLIELDLHPCEIPEELWTDPPYAATANRRTQETRPKRRESSEGRQSAVTTASDKSVAIPVARAASQSKADSGRTHGSGFA